MTTLGQAVALAKRGLPIFRLKRGTKDVHIDSDWARGGATTELFDVFEKFSGAQHNIGVLATGRLIIDVDFRKGGQASFDKLTAEIPALADTFSVATPNGLHVYFDAPDGTMIANSVEALGPGLDVRATNGYVVGPGSEVGGKPYVVRNAAAIAQAPAALVERCRLARQRVATAVRVVGDVDTEAAIVAARAYLERAPIAIEGAGGDQTTYDVACQVLDRGVSPDTALQLMAAHWNERCAPPWELGHLEAKVANAARYRQAEVGRDNPAGGFRAVHVEQEPSAFALRVRPYRGSLAQETAIAPRPWIVPGKLVREAVTLLGAPGSAGKSLYSLQAAVAIALGGAAGPQLIGAEIAEPTNVLVINNEDPDLEIDRRLAAVFTHFGVSRADAWGKIHIFSGCSEKFKIARRNAGAVIDGEFMGELRAYITRHKIGVVFFDPFVSLHESNENDNSDMQRVMDRLTSLAVDTHAAVGVVHHTNKPPMASSESYAGNVNAIRGASAVKDAARIALTMFGMAEKDGERYGVPREIRHRFVRLDDAKANLHLASDSAQWFQKKTVRIENGEDLGVLEPVDLRDMRERDAELIAAFLVPVLRGKEKGVPQTLRVKSAAELLSAERLLGDCGVDACVTRIVAAFALTPAVTLKDGTTVRFTPEGKSGGSLFLAA